MVDTGDLKSPDRKVMPVRVRPGAPSFVKHGIEGHFPPEGRRLHSFGRTRTLVRRREHRDRRWGNPRGLSPPDFRASGTNPARGTIVRQAWD